MTHPPGWQPPEWQPPEWQPPESQPPESQPPGWQPPEQSREQSHQQPGHQPAVTPPSGWVTDDGSSTLPGYAPPPTPWGQPAAAPAWTPPPQPGVVPLRPLGLGELLDGSVRSMRHNPRVMFGLSALVAAVTTILSTVATIGGLYRFASVLGGGASDAAFQVTPTAGDVSGLVAAFVVPAVVQGLTLSVLGGILVLPVSDAVIGRRPATREVLRRAGWAGVGRLVLLTVVVAVIFGLVIGVVAGVVAALYVAAVWAGVVATVLAVPGLLALLVHLWVRFAFAAPALMLERLTIRRALSRSWQVSAGSRWRVLGILLLTWVIASATSGVLQVPFSVVGQLLGTAIGGSSGDAFTTTLVVSTVVANLGGVLAAAVVSPFRAGVLSLLYIDLRIRREGLDVALTRAAAEDAARQQATPSGPAWAESP